MRDAKTGLFNPPQAPCVKGEGLMCPIRENPDSHFECLPEYCRLAKRKPVGHSEKGEDSDVKSIE